ncbi:MAG: SDR family NAD(P)-dependent oxidoreductase [Leptospiraceae bacterium]|nr:SDR family NAD(P)-dependent oxidoreductase [Leptospiraceae bacterium]
MKQNNRTAGEIVKQFDVKGKVFLVTGAYSGLGAATTKALLTVGAKVIIAGRNQKLQDEFLESLKKEIPSLDSNLVDGSLTLDLGSLASIKEFAFKIKSKYKQIDCLINNAGVMNTGYGITKDGFEVQMGTNVIGHFLLSKILVDITKRQVWLSSRAHNLIGVPPGDNVHDNIKAPRINLEIIKNVDEKNYDSWHRYQQSKLGDILLAKQFFLEYPHLKTCAVHPGVVKTNLGRHTSFFTLLKYLVRMITGKGNKIVTPEIGASTQTLCAIMPNEQLVNGGYYADCEITQEAEAAKVKEDAKKLYDYCNEVTKSFQVA